MPPYAPMLTVVVHTIVIYITLNVMLRLIGRREMGQHTVLDLVIILLLGCAVETAMVNADTSMAAGLVCAGSLLLTNRLLGRLFSGNRRFWRLLNSGPVLLVHDGKFVESHLQKAGLTHSDVLQSLREREHGNLASVRFAVLETDGDITVVPMSRPTQRAHPNPSNTVTGSQAPDNGDPLPS